MRGTGYTISRLPSARAFLAGAAILAGAFTSAAHGQMSGSGNGKGTLSADAARADEVAWAAPRPSRDGAAGVAFPRPLRPGDVALMRRVFAFQARGNIPSAIRAQSDLKDRLLLGSAIADRYLGRHYHTTSNELSDWLAAYGDQPEAPAIYRLLLKRLPPGAEPPPRPNSVSLARSADADPLPEDIDVQRNDLARDAGLDHAVHQRAGQGNAASALRLITASRRLSPAYAARLRAETAQILFTRNEDAEALRVARLALKDIAPADQPSLGFYIGGLAAWRLDRIDAARTLFEAGANATNTSARLHAASAFWAARASRVQHDADGAVKWLRVAAQERLTLHGLLARRILRMDTGILPSNQLLEQADVDAVAATPAGRRAFALLQVGQTGKAEAELRALWPNFHDSPAFGRSLMMVASAAGMTDCAAQMAALLQSRDGQRHEELRFPLPRLRPAGGFKIEPNLIYALTRIESNFDTGAISSAGARGLMQIMPATAQYIMGKSVFAARRLHEPASNLDIGQRYIAYLARQDGIDNDLIRILASYNSGPGSFARWGPNVRDNGDPLMFIEAIPVAETRAFVPHVLLYSWIYAARMHLPAASLDDLAAGEFPRFTPRGEESKMALLAPGANQ